MTKLAVINRNIVDLWGEPKFNSERISQILFGEQITVISKKACFAKIRQSDGYTGWVDQNFLTDCKSTNIRSNYVVTSKQAPVKDKDNRKADPYFLLYGTKINGRKADNNRIKVNFTGITPFYLNSSNLKPIISNKREQLTATAICNEAKRFLGVPYLWGGASPLGFDCSGLVQTIFGRFGLILPRDTKEQIKSGTSLNRDEIERGDLMFFKRHVGLALSSTSFIHCSAGGGSVTINSLDPGSHDYRKDLDLSFLTARRVLC